jgi:hypothetical protein
MASPAAVGGCGEGVPPGIENDPGFVKSSCQDPKGDMLRGLTPEPAVDYLALRSTSPKFAPGSVQTNVVVETGELCGGAADKPACTTLVDQSTNKDTFLLTVCVQKCEWYYMLATRGDSVLVLDTPQAVQALLGAIDTPQEAMLLVQMKGLDLPCDRGGEKPTAGGFDVQSFSREGCDGVTRHLFHVGADGVVGEVSTVVEIEANPNCIVGRRPAGLSRGRTFVWATPIARYLSNSARLEAASVHAFRHLASELARHGAPKRLIAAACRAAKDEVRHARVTVALARRFGADEFETPGIEPAEPRDLESIAKENIVEGCVRETFGAAVGDWQARHAQDAAAARTMRRIAEDETRHASLAWEVARWSYRKLGAAARRRVRSAGCEGVATLRNELRFQPDPSIIDTLGVPSSLDALRLHAELERALWSDG